MASAGLVALASLAAIGSYLYPTVNHRLTQFGVFRPLDKITNEHGHELRVIDGTVQCEDIHLHAGSGLLFTACQGVQPLDRLSWFPPLATFSDPGAARNGGIYVIDPKTFKAKQLKMTGGFSGPLVTHGIDVIADPTDPQLVHIFAVNHLPNPGHYVASGRRDEAQPKAQSQIELFSHQLGTDTVRWHRSVCDPMIITPNDIVATSPSTFYVTNDHYHREGFARQVEDLLTERFGGWTNVVYVRVQDRDVQTDPNAARFVVEALRGLHNNNGMGRGATPDEILVTDASGGVVYRTEVKDGNPGLMVKDRIVLDSTIDNPFYYHDPYANATHDASGYVLGSLWRAIDLSHWDNPKTIIPSGVWHVTPGTKEKLKAADTHDKWEKRAVFVDDGKVLRSSSAALILPIDPKENGGKKQGWLFTTGFASDAVIAARIDL